MSRVTSKLQITIPRAIARRHAIEPGTQLSFEDAGEAIRLVPASERSTPDPVDAAERLRLFDEATERQDARDPDVLARMGGTSADRGWKREDLYERDLPR
ncbi:MAG: AbrB/MazE/SpoVT family DNA-binding domain-containing protein [Deltaproteobacteria bacterium]|nr:AbrB/MazE/SpoVT family DNA-binding domain-containing protein [Deltaproteobacteria bacterium]